MQQFERAPAIEPPLSVRTLKIEEEGDVRKGLTKPKIRLMGRWLERARFKLATVYMSDALPRGSSNCAPSQLSSTSKSIADVLGHRYIDTTFIYAKADLKSLRQVAMPWPTKGLEIMATCLFRSPLAGRLVCDIQLQKGDVLLPRWDRPCAPFRDFFRSRRRDHQRATPPGLFLFQGRCRP
jgi:hypothetical protein